MRDYVAKILDREEARAECERRRRAGETVVFTNGCFDILHAGHADYLDFARRQGDCLVVGLNSDASVRRNKGPSRPIVPEGYRARMLAALESVDIVVIFDEDEPIALLGEILPDVLVKGADWAHYVSGREVVERRGGRVVLADLTPGLSTTELIRRVTAAEGGG